MITWPRIPLNAGNMEYNMCFGCGRDNPIGLKLDFKWDGKTASAEFTPGELHQGWSGFAHGGIITCLIDEAMAYAAFFSGVRSITARMQVRLRRLVQVGEPLIITSSITKMTKRLVEAEAAISLKDGTPVAEGRSTQFIVSIDKEPGTDVQKQE